MNSHHSISHFIRTENLKQVGKAFVYLPCVSVLEIETLLKDKAKWEKC